MLVDYWLAGRFGLAWLTVRRALRLRQLSPELPALCARVARRDQLSAAQLGMAEDFATAMWWRTAVIAAIPLGIIALATKGLFHGAALDVVVGLLVALVSYMGIALLQAVMAFARAAGNKAYLRKAGPDAIRQPLPAGELGVPSRWDFWAVLAAGATLCAILGYAALHNAPH